MIGFPASLILDTTVKFQCSFWGARITIQCQNFSYWVFAHFADISITQSMQADENLRSELEEDVKEECTKLGPVDSVKVIDLYAGND